MTFLPPSSSSKSTSLFVFLASSLFSCVTCEGDLVKVEVKVLNFKHSDYSDTPTYDKEISLVGKDNTAEKVRVRKIEGIFSKNMTVEKCGDFGCKEQPLGKKEEEKATRCSFTGRLDSDPDSTVYVSGCWLEKENMDISVMSKKSKLRFNTYRVDNTGKISVDKNYTFTDVIEEGEEPISHYNPHGDSYNHSLDASMEYHGTDDDQGGNDYSLDEDQGGKISILLDGATISYVDRKPKGNEKPPCCSPTKYRCKSMENGITRCTTVRRKKLCGNKCERFRYTLEKIYEKQKRKAERKRKWEEKKVQTEEAKPEREKEPIANTGEENSSEDSKHLFKSNSIINNRHRKEQMESSEESSEESDYSDEEENEESAEKKKGEAGKMGFRIKEGQKLNHKQLDMLESALVSKRREKSTNPACKSSMFKSASIISHICGDETCKEKLPYPKQKIYDEKMIEVGVYIDRHLYKNMEEVLKTQDEDKVKAQLLRVIHSLFLQVETFLMHPTFSSKGGFRIIINGIKILKKHGPLESDWDSQHTAQRLIRKFTNYANKVNSQCDGDRDSYDAMVLLTGRNDFSDCRNCPTGGSVGYAMSGKVCQIAPAIILTLRLNEEGNHKLVMPVLLAHEFGHLLGAEHDGVYGRLAYSIYNGKHIPCPQRESLMSPTVSQSMTEWSDCTRKQIDAMYDRREEKGENCFFT